MTGTVSVAVIVFEMTKQVHFSVPVLISVLTARAVASVFVESLYDTMLRLGRLPALPPTQSTDRQLRQVRYVCLQITHSIFIDLKPHPTLRQPLVSFFWAHTIPDSFLN